MIRFLLAAFCLLPTAFCFAQGGQATALRVDPATKVHRAALYSGATPAAQIAACLAGVQAQGGGTCDASGITGSATIGMNIFSGITNLTILRLSGTWTVTENLTVPINIILILDPNASLTPASGKTITYEMSAVNWHTGTPTAMLTDQDMGLPNLIIRRYDDTTTYTGIGGDVHLFLTGSVARFEALTGPHHSDRMFPLISQVFDGSRPAAVSIGPANDNVAAFFFAFGASGRVKGLESLNTVVEWRGRPTGTVNTNGTDVTWVSGDSFGLTGWANTAIEISHVVYVIASVTDPTHLVLTSSAGAQTGVPFIVGSAIFGIEVDVNNASGIDVDPASAVAYNGLGIVSGQNWKPLVGLSVGASLGAQNAWRYGAVISWWTHYGILAINPATTTAVGLDVTGGTDASAIIARGGAAGVIVGTGAVRNLLRLTPSADSSNEITAYGTNAANTSITWSISQGGQALFESLTYAAGGLPVVPPSDAFSATLYGPNAARTQSQWVFYTTGALWLRGTLTLASGTAYDGTLSHANTATRNWTLPNASGTIALAGDIGGPYVLKAGDTMTGDLTVPSLIKTDADGYMLQAVRAADGKNYGLYYDSTGASLQGYAANTPIIRWSAAGFDVTNGAVSVAGTDVITHARVLENVTADAGLITSGALSLTQSAAGNIWAQSRVTGDSFARVYITADGAYSVGPGSSPTDVNIYRVGALRMAVSGFWQVGGSTYASLGTPDTGTSIYCSDCDPPTAQGAACASAATKTGALALRIRGGWQCY